MNGRRQGAGDGSQHAIEGQFANGYIIGNLVAGQHFHGGEQGQGDEQVEMAAFLENVGGRQVDGNPFRRQGQAQGGQRGAHPLAAFGDGLVGQPDNGEGGQARRYLHLNIDIEHFDAQKSYRVDVRDHGLRAPSRTDS